jgi:hypothetical protein
VSLSRSAKLESVSDIVAVNITIRIINSAEQFSLEHVSLPHSTPTSPPKIILRHISPPQII